MLLNIEKIQAIDSFTLKEDQELFLEWFFQWMDTGKSMSVLNGFAGTGKTKVMETLLHALSYISIDYQDHRFNFILTAPTNKAAKVLHHTTGYPTQTIHRLLGLVVEENIYTNETSLNESGGAGIVDGDLIVIDEASLISEELFGQICEGIEGTTAKVLFLGDSYQLAPVVKDSKENIIPVFDKVSSQFTLTIMKRQDIDNPLLKVATEMRARIDGDVEGLICIKEEMKGDAGITVIRNESVWKQQMVSNWDDDSAMLSHTNKTVIHTAQHIRREVYGKDTLIPTEGETYITHKPINELVKDRKGGWTTTKKRLFNTGDEMTIKTAVRNDRGKFKGYEIEVYEREELLFIPLEPLAHEQYIGECRKKLRRLEREMGRGSATHYKNTHFKPLMRSYHFIRSSHSMTIHKSQGTTFGTVYLDARFIKLPFIPDEDKARLLYVAMTRTKGKVVVLL